MTLVLATDFSAEAQRAGAIAAGMAAPDETSIRLGLPFSPDSTSLLPEAEATLRNELAAQIQRASVPVTNVIVRAGTAAPETHLSVLAENERADLLIVGTRKHSWIDKIWAGSVSQGVVRAASTNITCVPRSLVEDKPAVPGPARVIVVATDLSPLGDAAVPLAYRFVADGGEVHLVHVVDAGPFVHRNTRTRDAELVTRLRERIPPEAQPKNVRTESRVLFGRTADELVKYVERVRADAICVGTHGRSGLGAVLLGSVSHEIIARSRCPVIVAPEPQE